MVIKPQFKDIKYKLRESTSLMKCDKIILEKEIIHSNLASKYLLTKLLY
jgi:hypothetical protein